MIFTDFFKALGQLPDPRFRGVLLKGIGLSLAALFGLTFLLVSAIQVFFPETLSFPLVGEVDWTRNVVSVGGFFLMLGLSVFLMVPVASAITSFFLDDVAQAVEDEHYKGLPVPPRIPFKEALSDTFAFLGTMILLNIVALMLSLLLPFFGFAIFYVLNGYLLGREYFQMVAMRRLGRDGAIKMRKSHSIEIWFAGCLMAVPLSFPLINLLVPVLGAATFTHLYHRLAD